VSPIESKMEAQEWLSNQLDREGPRLWTEQERRELAQKLAQDYRPGSALWRIKEYTERQGTSPVYVVTHGGAFGIHSVEGKEAHDKANAIMRALNALDREMSELGKSG
jgi:hypothetical protein